MNKKILSPILFLLVGAASSSAAPQMIAFERNQAVWIANLDGTGEKKIADGIFLRFRLMELASRLTPWKKRVTQVTCVISQSSNLRPES
jgi:hypothetical protein